SSCLFFMLPRAPRSTLFPYTTLFRSAGGCQVRGRKGHRRRHQHPGRGQYRDPLRTVGRDGQGKNQRVVEGVKRMRYLSIALSKRSEEHTSELQSRENLVCRLLLEKKK